MKFAEMSVVLLKNDVITTSIECGECYRASAVKDQDMVNDDC